MRVLLAGGGTAGHINPALAIAGYIKSKRPDTEFLFIGNQVGMEQRLVTQACYNIKYRKRENIFGGKTYAPFYSHRSAAFI